MVDSHARDTLQTPIYLLFNSTLLFVTYRFEMPPHHPVETFLKTSLPEHLAERTRFYRNEFQPAAPSGGGEVCGVLDADRHPQ